MALTVLWLLGPRQGKFTPEGIPTAMPGHNAVFVIVGSLLALLGWMGLTAGGAILFYSVSVGAALFAALNSMLAAAGGALGAFATTRTRFGKPDASLTANGWVAGLVAVSAGAPFFKMPQAILVGIVAGIATVFAIELIETRLHVDDPAGAIAVHGVGGIWGLLAVGMFAEVISPVRSTGADSGQFLAQLIGVGTLAGVGVPACLGANLLIDRFVKHRIDRNGERQGADLHELGAGAYPEFVIQREDFTRR
jgi:Amt family ammonium transporter